MIDIDASLNALKKIIVEFQLFCEKEGRVSEADTRVKLIDRILVDVCGWPESNLKREYHSDSGYSDYILSVHGKPLVTVEAKNEGEAFVLPSGDKMKSLRLNGAILTDTTIKKAIVQVRGYCDDLGIRYAIATNGYSWIIFRAINVDGLVSMSLKLTVGGNKDDKVVLSPELRISIIGRDENNNSKQGTYLNGMITA